MTVTIDSAEDTITIPYPGFCAISVNDPHDSRLLTPSNANYVPWTWARTLGQDLDIETVMATKLGANDILVIPEDENPFRVKVDQGWMAPNAYREDGTRYTPSSRMFLAMSRTRRGIVGLGPNAIIDQGPRGTFTEGPQTNPKTITVDGTPKTFDSALYAILQCTTVGYYFGNFTMRGQQLGGVAYSAITANKAGGCFERIKFEHAHCGFQNYPNGEAADIGVSAPDVTMRYIESDCRDNNGNPVGASPVMLNDCGSSDISDMSLHHAVAGMPTLWRCYGTHNWRNVRSEYNGSAGGGKNGAGINIEATRAEGLTLNYYNGTLKPNYSPTGNTGLHIKIGSSTGVAKINLYGTEFDKGPSIGNVCVQMIGSYKPNVQTQTDILAYDKVGNPVPVKYFF